MLPLLRTKKVMKTSSYRFKQRLWLLLGQSLCLNIEETVGNFMINQEILEHGVVNLKKR